LPPLISTAEFPTVTFATTQCHLPTIYFLSIIINHLPQNRKTTNDQQLFSGKVTLYLQINKQHPNKIIKRAKVAVFGEAIISNISKQTTQVIEYPYAYACQSICSQYMVPLMPN
jgi:hypothetical protein